MSLTFYYSPMSTATITQLVLEELGVPHEKVKLDLKKGETRRPDFLRLNPNGKVPLVVHDGTPIWESAAITMYLGEAFGVAKGLYPASGPKRGEAMKWIIWTNVTLGDSVSRWQRNTSNWTPSEQHNAKAAEAAQADVHHCLGILNEALEGKQFLTGGYTVVDTHVNSFIDWLRFMKVDFSAYPNLNAWSQRCTARPVYARVMTGG
ncbi:Glutathione S-transferase [Burkholderiales bacterium]|nr:Glutathione S-transferase [Burkholderiales bacterium]